MKQGREHELPIVRGYANSVMRSRSVRTMTLLVKRSEPLRTIMMSPTGKNMAEIVRIRPGAFCWYHGAASVANITAQLPDVSDWRLRVRYKEDRARKMMLEARCKRGRDRGLTQNRARDRT